MVLTLLSPRALLMLHVRRDARLRRRLDAQRRARFRIRCIRIRCITAHLINFHDDANRLRGLCLVRISYFHVCPDTNGSF